MANIIIKAVPGAKAVRIERMLQGLKVWLTELPEDGKANAQLIEVLAEHYGVSKSQISIKSGHASRIKIVKIG